MSTLTDRETTAAALLGALSSVRTRLVAALFGDRTGVTLFLGIVAVLGLCVRSGVFINDNYTLLNTLVAVSEGHLHLDRAVYGPGLGTPGTVTAGGEVYGRNYGQVFPALPVLFGLQALSAVADVRLLVTGAWSLCLLGTVLGVGTLLDRERLATGAGSLLALGTFATSVAVATDLSARAFPLLALQAVGIVAAGFVGVLVYRLLRRIHGPRVGIAAGIAAVVAIPVGFWATVPKRHVLVAGLAVAAAYLLYRSRERASEVGSETPALRPRAGAYVLPGLAAWIAAPEGVILGLAVAAADLSTLRRFDPREAAVVGCVTLAGFLPFFLTNLAIAEDPLTAPRYLSVYYPPADGGAGGGGTTVVGGTSGSSSTATPMNTADGSVPELRAGAALQQVFGQFVAGGVRLVTAPDAVWRTFVRSGYGTDTWSSETVEGANLSVLESTPPFGLFAGACALGARRGIRRVRGTRAETTESRSDATRVADRFALVYAVLLSLAYLPRLPLHAQVTVRYLVPMYPLLLYGVARLPAVRRAVDTRWQYVAWTYAGTVLIAGQLFLAGVTVLELTNGQSMQTHAVVNLTVGLLLALWAVAATLGRRREGPDRYDDIGAILLGLAAGAGTVLILLATVAYFPTGGFVLPLVPSL